jgi:Ca-activated chloride channel family protein
MMVQRGVFSRMQQNVNPSADLDEDTLNYFADVTGGQYFRARNPEELESIYDRLDELEPIEQESETYRPISALFYIPLAISFILSFLLAMIVLLPSYLGMYKTMNSATNK